MTQKNILVIDDEKVVHLIFKTVLSSQYRLFFAESAQKGIDILSEHPIHLVLLDIKMPEISGIELLESIVIDTALSRIPVIVMTADANMDSEIKARRFGAVEYLEKADLFYEKENILKLVEKHISPDDHKRFIKYDYKQTFRSILTILIATAGRRNFLETGKKLGEGLYRMFDVNYFTIWVVNSDRPEPAVQLVDGKSDKNKPDRRPSESTNRSIYETKRPYLNNKAEFESSENQDHIEERFGYMSEIGIPLYEISNEELSKNKWDIKPGTAIYGFVTLKRNRVFSTKEFKMLTRFIIHTGAILFELHKSNEAENH